MFRGNKNTNNRSCTCMGGRSHFEEHFLPHLDAAYNLARWIVGIDQDAQDVVQEAYLRAMQGLEGFRGGKGRAWLMTIVRNTAYSWIRKNHNVSTKSRAETPPK